MLRRTARRFPAGDTFNEDSLTWVMEPVDLQMLLLAISTATEIVMDLETTGLDEHEPDPGQPYVVEGVTKTGRKSRRTIKPKGCAARVVLAALTLSQPDDPDPTQPTTWIVPLSHPDGPNVARWVDWLTQIALAIHDAPGIFLNHNLKFDCRWTYHHTSPKIDLSRRIGWDTALAAHLMDENESAKLKEVAPKMFGVERWDDFEFNTPGAAEKVPLHQLGVYAGRDTYWTWRLFLRQQQLMFVDVNPEDGDGPYFPEEIVLARLGLLMKWCVMPQSRVLTSIEQRGVPFDVEWAAKTQAEFEKNYAALVDDIANRYEEVPAEGMSFAANSGWFMKWTAAAVERGDLKIIARTPTGGPSWKKAVLKRLARMGYSAAEDILDARGMAIRISYLKSWAAYASKSGGRIYSNYNQGYVVTGRLSSSGPNMQQVTKKLRPSFKPSRPDYCFVELDFSQIELRLAAFISQSIPMLEAYRDGTDLHRKMAMELINLSRQEAWTEWCEKQRTDPSLQDWIEAGAPIPGVPEWISEELYSGKLSPDGDMTEIEYLGLLGSRVKTPVIPEQYLITLDEVPGEARQSGKAANFGLLYGMSAMGFQVYAEDVYGVHFTREEAELAHAAFFSLWDGLQQWHINVGMVAQRDGQVVSPIGRVRRVPDIDSWDPKVVSGAHRVAINAPVQGFASDIMQIAAAGIEGVLPGVPGLEDVHLLGTVHDSIFLEMPIKDWERTVKKCQWYMTKLVPQILRKMDCELTVPLAADATVGTRWGLNDIADQSEAKPEFASV